MPVSLITGASSGTALKVCPNLFLRQKSVVILVCPVKHALKTFRNLFFTQFAVVVVIKAHDALNAALRAVTRRLSRCRRKQGQCRKGSRSEVFHSDLPWNGRNPELQILDENCRPECSGISR